ncbi:MAG: hypothetical protein II972_03740 [Elusimicrobiaceae bacterium]|nr:hypothetical protein [Elusimicrobiaceae bacterium]MBQ6224609.1 hypothetical protein [Campylobacter sp.]
MNKKGFSIIGILISVVILIFVVQFAMKQYKKSLSNVSALKLAGSSSQTGKNKQGGTTLRDGILLKASILPQLDNLLREQQVSLVSKGSYAKNISSLNTSLPSAPGYNYGVSDNKAGWVAWVKKTSGNNKFLISKNIHTKQLCCKDIDNGACKIVSVANITCPF